MTLNGIGCFQVQLCNFFPWYLQKQSINEPNHIKQQSSSQSDKMQYTVHRQPIALDRLSVHDVSQSEAAGM